MTTARIPRPALPRIASPSAPATEVRSVARLEEGDVLANLGIVQAPPVIVGAFVVVTVCRRSWALALGRPTDVYEDRVYHAADDVVVEVL
jgi:hypothetical protein